MYHFDFTPAFLAPVNRWEKEMERVFGGLTPKEGNFVPACEIREEEKYFTIGLDIPGLKKEELDIEIKDNHLYITGERKFSPASEQNNVVKTERRYGKFSRVFTLPQNVNAEGIEAQFENGVLEVMIPKEEKSTSKKISISGWKKEAATNLNS